MNKLRRDDEVIILTGKDKGKRGTISQMAGDRVTVNGVNMVKRHTKPNPNLGQPGGIVEREAAVHISNVAIFNPESNAADRVKIQVDENGVKKRIFSSNNQSID
jgi:large subunit ribosomal protein L24|tara:strand:- start:177 stop:488 length:312 start_codon:yes stop_codon:yes gene_type:complete